MIWLFLLPTLIWGSTWIVITFQFGTVATEVSVFYRFLIASVLALLFCRLKGPIPRFSLREHAVFALHGLFNFCMNYVLTYRAETMVTSGLVAVTFTLLPYFNSIGAKFFFKENLSRRSLVAMTLGGIGIFLLFRRELTAAEMSSQSVFGVAIGIIATGFASAGNLTAQKYRKMKIDFVTGTSFAMAYGACFIFLLCLFLGREFNWDSRPIYLGSLAYLAVLGTVIAFLTYFTLISKVGAPRAAYTSIAIPVIALLISTVFENFQWTWSTWIGIGLILMGNILIIKSK